MIVIEVLILDGRILGYWISNVNTALPSVVERVGWNVGDDGAMLLILVLVHVEV